MFLFWSKTEVLKIKEIINSFKEAKTLVTDNVDQDRQRAEIFDALSHPTRIMILKALSDEVLGFADLKKKLGIESSGHLQII